LTAPGGGQVLNRVGNQAGPELHSLSMDPRVIQYFHRSSDYATHAGARPSPSQGRNYFGTSHGDLEGVHKAYLEVLLAQKKQQYELPHLGKSGGFNHGYYGNPSYGFGMPYPIGSGTPVFHNERISHLTSMMRSSMGGSIGSWHSDISSNMEGGFASTLLDEFKNNRTRSFELSDIVGNVVEFR